MNAKTLYKTGFAIILVPILLAVISWLGFVGCFIIGFLLVFLGMLVEFGEEPPRRDKPKFTTCPNCGARERATSTTCHVCDKPL